MVNNEIPDKCPSCGSEMRAVLLRCPSCDTEVQGDFEPGRFSSLNEEQKDFLEIFIKSRGSLKDVGKYFNISYPTARNRLNDLVHAFESIDKKAASVKRLEVLKMLKAGEISVEDAMEQLS